MWTLDGFYVVSSKKSENICGRYRVYRSEKWLAVRERNLDAKIEELFAHFEQ